MTVLLHPASARKPRIIGLIAGDGQGDIAVLMSRRHFWWNDRRVRIVFECRADNQLKVVFDEPVK